MWPDWIAAPEWSFVGVILGLLSFVFAYLLYRRSKKIKRVKFEIQVSQIVGEEIEALGMHGLKMSFRGEPITELYDCRITLWNAGNDIVELGDFASTRQPEIRLPSGRSDIIGVSLVACSGVSQMAAIEDSGDATVGIRFEYLAPRDWLTVSLLSKSKIEDAPSVEGLIKGAGEVMPGNRDVIESMSLAAKVTIILPVFGVFLFVMSLLSAPERGSNSLVTFVAMMVCGIASNVIYEWVRSRLPGET